MDRYCLLIILGIFVSLGTSWKPIVMFHGYDGSASDFNNMIKWISELHNGTQTYSLPLFEGDDSHQPLDVQVNGVIQAIEELGFGGESNPFILIGHSQGGLVTRVVAQHWQKGGIDLYVSLAGPQMGIFGFAGHLGWLKKFGNISVDEAYLVLYTYELQTTYSAANMWNDPYHQSDYLSRNYFLPIVNNQTFNPISEEFRNNFLSVGKMAFFGSPADGSIDPWESTQWAYWAADEASVVPMEQQPLYVNDWLGLKELNEQGRLMVTAAPNVTHVDWIDDYEVFVEYILPLFS